MALGSRWNSDLVPPQREPFFSFYARYFERRAQVAERKGPRNVWLYSPPPTQRTAGAADAKTVFEKRFC